MALRGISVIVQWIGHPPVVHWVVSSPLVGSSKYLGVLVQVSHKTYVIISTQVLVLNQHKLMNFIYDRSVLLWRTQTCEWQTQDQSVVLLMVESPRIIFKIRGRHDKCLNGRELYNIQNID